MPPEQVLKKSSQSYGVDMWSAGIVLLEFLTSRHTLLKNLKFKRERSDNPTPLEYSMGFLCTLAVIFGTKKVEEICHLSGKEHYGNWESNFVRFPRGVPRKNSRRPSSLDRYC